jgi:predicted methyltransferase
MTKLNLLACAMLLAAPAHAAVPLFAVQAVQNPDRPPADTARDAARHTLGMLIFSEVKPGDRVADLMPGGGFFTRVFSNAVGPKGTVYAIIPAELAKVKPALATQMTALASAPAFANVIPVVEPASQTGTKALESGGRLDVVWTSDNYHDLYGYFGPAAAAATDAAIFRALKPGGVYIVVDHVALPGASATAPTTLHRIDPEEVKAQVLAAGFVLDAGDDVLRNPADQHTLKVFDPAIRGHTDQFVFRFRKPAH